MNCLLLPRLTSAIFTALLTLYPTPGQVQKATGLSPTDATLNISAKESSVKSGAPIWVDVTLENKSDHVLLVFRVLTGVDDDQGGWVYGVVVKDEKAQNPQATGFKTGHGSGASIPLQSGKRMTDRINICKLYDLSRPGKYRMQVYRYGMGNAMLLSNTITVTVTP